MPVFEMRMIEGAFGAAPGDALTWDNRWDMSLQMRWNLTDLCTRCEKRRIADAQRQQAHLAYEDLKAKLAAGVQEARETILGGSEEIRRGIEQVRYAQDARKLSRERLDNNIQGASPSEVLLSLQSLGLAQINYVSAIRDYDKAQLRLLILTGGAHAAPLPPPGVCLDEHK
jgi:outer membrane protein TolC